MFIAFKWLVGMAMAMWAMLCCIDFYLKSSKEINEAPVLGCNIKPLHYLFKNLTKDNIVVLESREAIKIVGDKQKMAVWHCAMFIAGALAVSLYNKKMEIVEYTKSKIDDIHFMLTFQKIRDYFKFTALIISIAITQYVTILMVIVKRNILRLKIIFDNTYRPKQFNNLINLALLQKLKEVGEERKHLGQLLIAAIHENKNIRLQYQLENMAKNRLSRHIEDSQKQIKENRSRYVNFQQLYLVTNKENMFLKSRIVKLTKEKEDAEKSLMALLNEVYRSKNKELKAYCSRFIVNTKNNLLNSDVKSEVQHFLRISKGPGSRKSDVEINYGTRRSRALITEIIQGDSLIPLVTDAPRFKGLPGECIWTVKDKHGIIEKLYEYDYESDFDNGDTIRRIREYSVYHDKDCLLDFVSSRTIMDSTSSEETLRDPCSYMKMIPSDRFLTNSSAFKHFLQSNTNIVSTTKSSLSFRV